jgi:hypothetical protein
MNRGHTYQLMALMQVLASLRILARPHLDLAKSLARVSHALVVSVERFVYVHRPLVHGSGVCLGRPTNYRQAMNVPRVIFQLTISNIVRWPGPEMLGVPESQSGL